MGWQSEIVNTSFAKETSTSQSGDSVSLMIETCHKMNCWKQNVVNNEVGDDDGMILQLNVYAYNHLANTQSQVAALAVQI